MDKCAICGSVDHSTLYCPHDGSGGSTSDEPGDSPEESPIEEGESVTERSPYSWESYSSSYQPPTKAKRSITRIVGVGTGMLFAILYLFRLYDYWGSFQGQHPFERFVGTVGLAVVYAGGTAILTVFGFAVGFVVEFIYGLFSGSSSKSGK